MKTILYAANTKTFEEKLKDYNFSYETDYLKLKERIKDYEGLIAFGLSDDIDLSHLKWIQSLGAGVDWALNNKSLNENVTLTRVTKGLNQLLFEYTLTRILFYNQNLLTHYNNQLNNKWERNLSASIVGKKVLIIGTGKIGSYMGSELNKLKMDVYGVNSTAYSLEGFNKTFTFDTIPGDINFDFVVNVLPSTSKTINIFNKDFFNKVKMEVFINVGRGNSLVEEDLVEALNNNVIKKAFLDVFQEEPLKENSKLWGVNNLVITSHIAAFMDTNNLVEIIKSNYDDITSGKEVEKVDLIKGY